MDKERIVATIARYRQIYPDYQYIRVCLPKGVIIPVEVNSLNLINEESNEWIAKAAGGDNIGLPGDDITEFREF